MAERRMSSSAIGVAAGQSARNSSRPQKGDSSSGGSRQQMTNTILKRHSQQPAQDHQYQVPYQHQQQPQQPQASCSAYMAAGPYATTQVPLFYNQPMPLGPYAAHTISRASNLYKHYAGDSQPMPAMKNQQSNAGAHLVYHEQPFMGYASGPVVGLAPMLANGGEPCAGVAALSLAARDHKERGPIPTAFINGGGTIGPALMRQYADQRRQYQQRHSKQLIYHEAAPPIFSPLDLGARFNKPLCRCRVMYLGSSVPHITKNGLHGIQEPLKHLYPEEKFSGNSLRRRTIQQRQAQQNMTIDISHLSASLGIDSWLSVWSNGLLLENVDEFGRDIRRFFSIESLHYCAAVRYFDTGALAANSHGKQQSDSSEHGDQDYNNNSNNNNNGQDSLNSSGIEQDQENQRPEAAPDGHRQQQPQQRRAVRFLPLDAPIFQYPNMMDPNHPPVFAAIMRRTSGVKVLECHAFICRRDAASNALVRCCTHAYADFLSAKRMSAEFGVDPASVSLRNSTIGRPPNHHHYQAERGPLSERAERAAAGSQRNSMGPADLGPKSTKAKRQEPIDGQQQQQQQQHRSRRAARSLSTGGTNSQEMTHSDENSLDADDSEDNYAIIMRQSARENLTLADGAPHRSMARLPTREGPRESRDPHRRHRAARSAKGSSKSLFRSFMPSDQLPAIGATNRTPANDSSSRRRPGKTALQEPCGRFAGGFETTLRAGDRLSHSLDFLLAPGSSIAGACCPAPALAGVWPEHEIRCQNRDSVKYSIVANKQRRHSKSMQQLVQVPAALDQPSEPAEMGTPRVSFAWKRAASCQDIGRGSLSRSSSLSSHRRRRGPRRRHQSGSRRSSVSSSHNNLNSIVGSQSKLSGPADDPRQQQPPSQDRRPHSRRRQLDTTSGRIYATTCSSEDSTLPMLLAPPPPPPLAHLGAEAPAQVRVLRADCCANQQQQAASSSSSAGSSRTRPKSSRRHREEQQSVGALNSAPAFVDPIGGYYQFMRPPPPPPLPAAALDQPRPGCYNPAGLVYCAAPSGQPSFYSMGPQMGVTPQPAAYYPFAYHQQPAAAAPGHLLVPPGTADSPLYNGAYLLPGSSSKSATMKRSSKASKEARAASLKHDSKLARKSQTLATRFRCLSPPLSFLSGGSDRASATVLPPPPLPQTVRAPELQLHIDQQQQQQHGPPELQQVTDPNNNNCSAIRQSVGSISSSTTNASSGCQVSPSHVVSGRPVFMSVSTGGSQMAPSGALKSESGGERPKMSWIKRLSLTLSSGSSSTARHSSKSSALRAEQAAEFYRNIQEVELQQQQQQLQELTTVASSETGEHQEGPEFGPSQNHHLQPKLDEQLHTNNSSSEPAEKKEISDCQPPGDQFEAIVPAEPEVGAKPQDGQAKSKRKKGGFFSGSLTLGRKSRVKSGS